MENYNRKKREAEEEERKRLLKLVEHEYRYKSDTYDSANNTLTTTTTLATTATTTKEQELKQLKREQPTMGKYEPLKDHSQDKRDDGGEDGIEMTRRRGRSDTINSVDGMYYLIT